MRIPDVLVYTLALGALVFALSTRVDRRAMNAPERPPISVAESKGIPLPAISASGGQVIVEVPPASSGLGTAFAFDRDGWWLTARHVVDACDRVGIVVGNRSAVPVQEVHKADFADLALLKTKRAPDSLRVEKDESQLYLDQIAFHFGYPQGAPGEAVSRLLGRETLIARGRYETVEPVLAWAETGRTEGLDGSLAGMSGGPVLDADGNVIGVTVAESLRKGRIYTATPQSIARLIAERQAPEGDGEAIGRLTALNYGPEGDRLRRSLSIAQVICVTGQSGVFVE